MPSADALGGLQVLYGGVGPVVGVGPGGGAGGPAFGEPGAELLPSRGGRPSNARSLFRLARSLALPRGHERVPAGSCCRLGRRVAELVASAAG
jgi:hypothetical protein